MNTTKTDIKIDQKIKNDVKTQVDELGQVVLHFTYKTPSTTNMDSLIRIWPTTYLYDLGSAHKSELVHAENIVYYPFWMICPAGKDVHFTLIFSGLPKSCSAFDFIEHLSLIHI